MDSLIAAAGRAHLLDREAIRARFDLRFSSVAMARHYVEVYGDLIAARRPNLGAGLKLGDSITLSVLGRELDARIVAFRKIEWGGFGASGIGRELGPTGLGEYLEAKHVYENLRPSVTGWFAERKDA